LKDLGGETFQSNGIQQVSIRAWQNQLENKIKETIASRITPHPDAFSEPIDRPSFQHKKRERRSVRA
jgi:hypothetical protein